MESKDSEVQDGTSGGKGSKMYPKGGLAISKTLEGPCSVMLTVAFLDLTGMKRKQYAGFVIVHHHDIESR
jgi:hypothetical protein